MQTVKFWNAQQSELYTAEVQVSQCFSSKFLNTVILNRVTSKKIQSICDNSNTQAKDDLLRVITHLDFALQILSSKVTMGNSYGTVRNN